MKQFIVILTVMCLFLISSLLTGCGITKSAAAVPSPIPRGIIQFKVCEVGSNGFVLPCQFDNPVTAGDLIVVVGVGGCNPLLTKNACDSISDSQINAWHTAIVVSQYNGIPLWYALNANGGFDTIYFAPNTNWRDIIAEYPPSTGLEGTASASYTDAGLTPAGIEIQDNVGWTRPVETTEPCELLISWTLVGQGTPIAGPYFAMRAYGVGNSAGLALEDSTANIPGYYMAGMSWRYANAWDEGLAAFRVGGCK